MIILECEPDEDFVNKISENKKIKHTGGKGNVLNRLLKIENGLGIVDDDPGSANPNNMKKFEIIKQIGNIRLYKNQQNQKLKLIVITPRYEDWLYRIAELNEVYPRKFNLPKDPDRLHDIPRYYKRNGYKEFLSQIIESKGEILTIKSWINKFG